MFVYIYIFLVEVEVNVHGADGLIAAVLLHNCLGPATKVLPVGFEVGNVIVARPPERTCSTAVPVAHDLAPPVVVGIGPSKLGPEQLLRCTVELLVEGTVGIGGLKPVLTLKNKIKQIKKRHDTIGVLIIIIIFLLPSMSTQS